MATIRRGTGWLPAAAAGLAGCGDHGVDPPAPPTSVRFVAGRTATDTIGVLVQALVVEVPGARASVRIKRAARSASRRP